MKVGGTMGNVGRPKLEISRDKAMTIRLTNFEFEKISKIAKKKNISKTEAVLQGIDLLIAHKPKRYKSFAKNPGQNEPGVVRENSDDD